MPASGNLWDGFWLMGINGVGPRAQSSHSHLRALDARLRRAGCIASLEQHPACALSFEEGGTGYQILASRRNRGAWPVLLPRRDFHAGRDGRFAGVN